MKETKLTQLKKRYTAEMWIIGFAAVAALVYGIICLVRLGGGNAPRQYLTNAVYSFAMAAELLLLCLIFADIRKKGKPFSRSVIIKLRIMSVILILAGMMPSYIDVSVEDGFRFSTSTFNFQNMLIIAIGVVILIVSEIFTYGKELQEDNDLIA